MAVTEQYLSHKWPPMTMLEGRQRRLDDTLVWRDGEHSVIVPEGFVCDLASIPRLLWWWAAPDGDYRAAVAVHDYHYGPQRRVSRAVADRDMRRIMLHVKSRRTRAWAMWVGLRLFGWYAWRENQCKD